MTHVPQPGWGPTFSPHLSHPHVVVAGDGGILAQRVYRVLAAHWRIVWLALDKPLPPEMPVVLVAPWLDDLASNVVERLATCPLCVLVTNPAASNLRRLAHLPPVTAVVTSDEIASELRTALQREVALLPSAGLASVIDDMATVPTLLRALVRKLLYRADWRRSKEPPVRSVVEAAQLVNCSRSHLYAVARPVHVDLHRLVDAVTALAAVEMKAATGETWEAIAFRTGFTTGAGLTALIKRALGKRPTDLPSSMVALATANVLSCLERTQKPQINDMR